MAPLALTIEAGERVGSKGDVVTKLDEARLREDLRVLGGKKIEALTVSLVNAFANDRHEQRIKEIAQEVLPGIPVSLSSEVVPEMQEYERTVTTVANSYVRPREVAVVLVAERPPPAHAEHGVALAEDLVIHGVTVDVGDRHGMDPVSCYRSVRLDTGAQITAAAARLHSTPTTARMTGPAAPSPARRRQPCGSGRAACG